MKLYDKIKCIINVLDGQVPEDKSIFNDIGFYHDIKNGSNVNNGNFDEHMPPKPRLHSKTYAENKKLYLTAFMVYEITEGLNNIDECDLIINTTNNKKIEVICFDYKKITINGDLDIKSSKFKEYYKENFKYISEVKNLLINISNMMNTVGNFEMILYFLQDLYNNGQKDAGIDLLFNLEKYRRFLKLENIKALASSMIELGSPIVKQNYIMIGGLCNTLYFIVKSDEEDKYIPIKFSNSISSSVIKTIASSKITLSNDNSKILINDKDIETYFNI